MEYLPTLTHTAALIITGAFALISLAAIIGSAVFALTDHGDVTRLKEFDEYQ